MTTALTFPTRRNLTAFLFILISAACLFGAVPGAKADDSPWLVNSWKFNFDIPPGNYVGPRGILPVGKATQIGWLPGSQVANLDTQLDSGAGMQATGCQFRKLTLGLSLKGKMDFRDCLLDECVFRKINPWYDKKDPATHWRFTNCFFFKSFMGNEFGTTDCVVRAVGCTFRNVKMPGILYRGQDVVNQAQQDWLKFEKCRFVNCEIGERFLAATTGCVFENCRYTGPDQKFRDEVSKPFEVKAYWSGPGCPESRTGGNLTLTFLTTEPPAKAGSILECITKNGLLTLGSLPSPGPAVVLAANAPKSIMTDINNPDGPGEPGNPSDSPVPAAASTSSDSSVVTGTAGAPPVPLLKTKSVVNALLVIQLPGQGVAGAAAKLSALALPIDPQASTEVKFNQKVGPMMQTALGEVVKCLQARHKGWPRGHRIELAFEDKFDSKDGPSAAVACALLIDSMIGNWEIDPAIAFTGDLNADSSVQPIGGVSGKIRGATKAGCLRVAVPVKNASAVGDVLLTDGPEPLARIEIFSIDTLDAAIALARKAPAAPSGPAAAAATASKTAGTPAANPAQLFQDVRRVLLPGNRWNAALLRDRNVQARLREVLRLQPNDLSARYLLAFGTNTAPAKLTLRGSVELMDQIAVGLLNAIKSKEASAMARIGGDQVGDAVFRLRRCRVQMDARVLPSVDTLTKFGEVLRIAQNQLPRTANKINDLYQTLMTAANEADRQRALLMNNREVVEELMK
ncbi:MAG: S16 family serine protease [Verrucomicrobiota bacterium]